TMKATGKSVLPRAFALLLAASLAGCGTSKMTTGSVSRPSPEAIASMSASELHDNAARLGSFYARDPNDKVTAMRYSSVLQMTGQGDQSVAVMRTDAITHSKHRYVMALYGKVLASAGQLKPALDAMDCEQTPE